MCTVAAVGSRALGVVEDRLERWSISAVTVGTIGNTKVLEGSSHGWLGTVSATRLICKIGLVEPRGSIQQATTAWGLLWETAKIFRVCGIEICDQRRLESQVLICSTILIGRSTTSCFSCIAPSGVVAGRVVVDSSGSRVAVRALASGASVESEKLEWSSNRVVTDIQTPLMSEGIIICDNGSSEE